MRADRHRMPSLALLPTHPNTNMLTNPNQAGANGAQQAGSWACRETFVAVIIGNAPMIYPLFRRMARRAGCYITTTYGGAGGATSQSYPLSEGDGKHGSHEHTSTMQSKKKRFRHPLSIPDTQLNFTVHEEAEDLGESGFQTQAQTLTRASAEGDKRKRGSALGMGREWERLSGEDGEDREGITVVRETIVKSKDREGRESYL